MNIYQVIGIILLCIGFFGGGILVTLTYNTKNITDPISVKSISSEDVLTFSRTILFKQNITLSKFAGTGSMLPLLDNGNMGIDIEIDYEDINVGDIVIFEKGNYSVVHQVIEKLRFCAVTKGINNEIDDVRIEKDKIKRKIIGIIFTEDWVINN